MYTKHSERGKRIKEIHPGSLTTSTTTKTMTNKQFAEKLLAALEIMKDTTPRPLWEDMRQMAYYFKDEFCLDTAENAPVNMIKMEEILLCCARDWLHHVQGCSHFGFYPACTNINLHYFGKDSDTWGKTPSGKDCDRHEAVALGMACHSLCRLADSLRLFSSL